MAETVLTCHAITSKQYLKEFHSFQNFLVRSGTSLKDVAIYCCLQSHHLQVLRRNCARTQLTTLGKHSARPPFLERCCETTTNYVMIVPFNAPPFPCQGLILNSLVTYHVEFILTWKPNKETLKSIHFMTEEQ